MNTQTKPLTRGSASRFRKNLRLGLFAIAALLVPSALLAAPGDIYECDFGTGAIYRFTPGGTKSTFPSGFINRSLRLAFDFRGNVFVGTDDSATSILKFTPGGIRSVFATGMSVGALVFDSAGNLFVADLTTNSIFKFTPNGTKNTFVTGLHAPNGLAFDASGNLFVAEGDTHSISKFSSNGTKSIFSSDLDYPLDLVFDENGNLYVSDSGVVVKFTPTGTKSNLATFASIISGITYDGRGHLYVSGRGSNSIIQLDLTGAQTTFASNLNQPFGIAVEPAVPVPGALYVTSAPFSNPGKVTLIAPNQIKRTLADGLVTAFGVVFDSKGNLYVVNDFDKIIKIAPDGTRITFASGLDHPHFLAIDSSDNLFDGESSTINKFAPSGTKTLFATVMGNIGGLAFDSSGNLFAATTPISNAPGSVIKITPAGVQSSFVTGLAIPQGLAFDPNGNLFVAESNSHTISKFTPGGNKTTFASNLSRPTGLAFDSAGNLYETDSDSGSIFKFGSDGTKTTFAMGLSSPYGLAFERPTGRPLNISTRLKVETGDNVLIAGFIITGPDAKNVLIRGIGPSLTSFGVPGALQDPVLELHTGATTLKTNDNWKIDDSTGNSQQASIQGTGIPPTDDRESAINFVLGPGSYTAILRGKNGTAGIGLVEVYDLSQTVNFSNVANISTRGFVDVGDNVMIGGFIIGGGDGYGKILLRGIGPSLAAVGVPNGLINPRLELHNGSGALIDQNDDWKTDNQTAIEATGIPPKNDLEAAILTTLPAGSYTAILNGNGGTGVGLVEVYNLK
jgi:sugar lactone lactonase YvrE